MNAALAMAYPPPALASASRIELTMAVAAAENRWAVGKQFREPDPRRLAIFRPRVEALLDYATRNGRRVAWATFTTRTRAPAGVLGRRLVAKDLARGWQEFRNKAAWRGVEGALVIHADHGRPHIHAVVVLAEGTSIRALRSAWTSGITHATLVAGKADALSIARYCAAQAAASPSKASFRRRSFSYRDPPAEHLVYQPTPYTPHRPAPPAPPPASPWRAAGGHAPFGETAATGQRAAPSWRPQADSGRPKAGGTSSGPGAGVEANCPCPPCTCETPRLRLVLSNPSPVPRMTMPTLVTPPLRHTSYDAVELQIGTNVLRTVMPRDRTGAAGVYTLVSIANLEQGLVEEVLKGMLYADEVRRRRDGRTFAYWATSTMPSIVSVPIMVPDRLRHFMVPTTITTRP